MTYQRQCVRFGLGVSGFGALAHVLTVFLLFTLPQRLLDGPTASAFLEAWFYPVATVGGVLVFYGTPVLAGLCGCYLVYAETATVRNVLVGFVVGGVAFGAAVMLVNWGVTVAAYHRPTPEYALQFVRLVGLVLAPAAVGALASEVVRNRR